MAVALRPCARRRIRRQQTTNPAASAPIGRLRLGVVATATAEEIAPRGATGGGDDTCGEKEGWLGQGIAGGTIGASGAGEGTGGADGGQ